VAQQGDAGVARIMESDWFFEVEPPLSGLWLYATGKTRGRVGPGHSQFFRELTGHMMSACTLRSLVSLLQGNHMRTREQLVV
jgi:hypothetical protein